MTDWPSWQKHVSYVVEKRGMWIGIGDADGNPLFTLPDPVSRDIPEQWMSTEDLSLSFHGRRVDGTPTLLNETLLVDALRNVDANGQLGVAEGDYTILLALPGVNGEIRRGGNIVFATGVDVDNDGVVDEITVAATSFSDVWNTVPAMSWPASWWRATPYERTQDEAGLTYSQVWEMARIEMATNPVFTWKNGPAGFVIRRLAQESLDAFMFTQQDPDGTRWVDDPYHVVEVPEVDTTPEISLEARDGFLYDTVADQAKNAGVILGARLWWPGDAPVRSWNLVDSSMTPEQVDISPSEGESQRTVDYRSFDHAMIVLTVKEVGV